MSDSNNNPETEKQQRHKQPKKWTPPQLLGTLYKEMKKHAVNQPDSEGQTVGELAKLIAKKHPSLGLTSPSKTIKTIETYIEHLKVLGNETNLFTIQESFSENDMNCTKVHYKFQSVVEPHVEKLMYEAFSNIKGISNKNIEMTSVLKTLYYVIDKLNSESKNSEKHPCSRIYSSAKIKYSSYKEDKNFDLENPKEMTVFPLKIIIYRGVCYLLCVEKGKKQLLRLRIDRITQVNCQRDKNGTEADFIKKLDSVKSPYGDTLFMCQGKEYEISISFDKEHINEVLDWFGMNIVIGNDGNGRYSATVFATKEGIIRLALMYSDWLKVTGPDRAVNEIKKAIRYAAKGYDMYKKSEK